MLLFTYTGLMAKLTQLFQSSFHFLDFFNRKANIFFIAIGIVGALYWLWRQNSYNKQADQQSSIK
ncbi:MAG TPA: hypothetical protein VII99_15655 [Bacteroidia bacterium]